MRLLKKLTAVAAVATVCCAMNLPVAAGAGTYGADFGKCPPHLMVRDEGEYFATTSTHDYVSDYVKGSDGTITEIIETCTIITEYLHHNALICTKCGISRVEEYTEYLGVRHTKKCGAE